MVRCACYHLPVCLRSIGRLLCVGGAGYGNVLVYPISSAVQAGAKYFQHVGSIRDLLAVLESLLVTGCRVPIILRCSLRNCTYIPARQSVNFSAKSDTALAVANIGGVVFGSIIHFPAEHLLLSSISELLPAD